MQATNFWCGWWDLNPHASQRHPLKMVCLPFHHNRLYNILSKKKASFLLVTRRNGAEDRNRTGTDITIRGILSPVRLPVPPPRHIKLEATPRFELGNKGFADLCLTTWLCRLIWSGKRDSNSRPSPWQGDALPLSYFRTISKLTGDPEGTRTLDLRRDRAAF